jgi:opacity protein-like surface antigen
MKRLLLVAMVVLLAVGVMNAGERMTKNGTWSLNFTMNGLGDFGVGGAPAAGIEGVGTLYGFGGSLFLNDDMALRVGLGFANHNENVTGPPETDHTVMGFGVTPALLWYFGGEGPVAAYWGPSVSYGMYSIEDATTPAAVGDTKQTWSQFGVGVVMGAQWWAWDQVAFNAEYLVSYNSASSDVESGGTTTDGPTITNFGINSWSVGVGLFFAR